MTSKRSGSMERVSLSPPEIFRISNLQKNKQLTDSPKSLFSPTIAVFHTFTLLNEICPAKRLLCAVRKICAPAVLSRSAMRYRTCVRYENESRNEHLYQRHFLVVSSSHVAVCGASRLAVPPNVITTAAHPVLAGLDQFRVSSNLQCLDVLPQQPPLRLGSCKNSFPSGVCCSLEKPGSE